ncbi:MAG TPA: hypothetical protein VE988_16945 [Gemmataceae bacterium]|nr:hypothetical protein [Gemmataceae bacterium]
MDYHEQFVRAAIDASQRSRRVLLFIQAFGILWALVLLNTCGEPWIENRIKVTLDARLLYSAEPRPVFLIEQPGPPRQLVPALSAEDDVDTKAAAWVDSCMKDPRIADQGISRDALLRAAAFILTHRYSSLDIEKRLEAYQRIRDDNAMSVPVPLTGLRIDVNDFGIMAGLGLAILLAWFALSLSREFVNLDRLKDNPQALAVVQAHTVFCTGGMERRSPVLKKLILALQVGGVAVPVLFFSLILVNDLRTANVAAYLGQGPVQLTLWTEAALFAVNLCLAGWCVAELLRVSIGATHTGGANKPQWPSMLPEQFRAVVAAARIHGHSTWTTSAIAHSFAGARIGEVQQVLESLCVLGLVIGFDKDGLQHWRLRNQQEQGPEGVYLARPASQAHAQTATAG